MTARGRYKSEAFIEALTSFGFDEGFTSADLADRTRRGRTRLTNQQVAGLLRGCRAVRRLGDTYPTVWVRIRDAGVSD